MRQAIADLQPRAAATREANLAMAANWGWSAALDRLLDTDGVAR